MDDYYLVDDDAPITQTDRDYIYRMLVDASDEQSQMIYSYITYLETQLLQERG